MLWWYFGNVKKVSGGCFQTWECLETAFQVSNKSGKSENSDETETCKQQAVVFYIWMIKRWQIDYKTNQIESENCKQHAAKYDFFRLYENDKYSTKTYMALIEG